MQIDEIWQENDSTLTPLHFFIPLDPNLDANPFDSEFCSQLIRSLNFGVFLVLKPSLNPPLIQSWDPIGLNHQQTCEEQL